MADLDRFEARIASALNELADEAPTDVDVARVVERVTTAGRARRWSLDLGAPRLPGALRLSLGATAQAVLVLAAIAMLAGAIVLSQRIAPTPYDGPLFGRITCSGDPWTSSRPEAALLDCSTAMQDPRLVGSARIEVGAAMTVTSFERRHGSVVLRASGATWVGTLDLTVGRNGTAVGDAVLEGRADVEGLVTQLHLVSVDGVTWGLVGSMRTTR